MLMVVTRVSKAGCDPGKVAQKGVIPVSPAQSIVPSEEILPYLVTDLNMPLSPPYLFNNRYCQEAGDNSRGVQGLLGHA